MISCKYSGCQNIVRYKIKNICQKLDKIKNKECDKHNIKLIRFNKNDKLSRENIIKKVGVL